MSRIKGPAACSVRGRRAAEALRRRERAGLDLLFEQREAVLESLPPLGATTLEAVAAKLAVVERLVDHDDHPDADAMIAGARQDLLAQMKRS